MTLRVRLGLVVATVMCITTGGLLASGRSQQPFAASGLPANTWVNLRAGGVVSGNGVGDEGYSTFVYSPGLKKGLVFAKYHAFEMGGGEDQNALLAYDFGLNRWDVLEITEDAWSEHLPGVGHDQGNVVIDPRRDWYITRGNMTLHGNTGYQTYIYDVRAGRGKRMTPAVEPNLYHSVASAFDPDRGVMLSTRGPAWLYDPDKNTWTEVGGSPSDRAAPALDVRRRSVGRDLDLRRWVPPVAEAQAAAIAIRSVRWQYRLRFRHGYHPAGGWGGWRPPERHVGVRHRP